RDGGGPGSGRGRRAARPRHRGAARRRRLGHADDPLGQHQRADHHDWRVRISVTAGRPRGSRPVVGGGRSFVRRSTFVLVHGAWHGSWCWKRVRKALQARGHEAFTPTLTGVGERSHLFSPHVNPDTHVEDVVNPIRWEDLSGVVLCGHSYGGCVITGVTDRLPDRIGALVYLDAVVPEDGQSMYDFLPGFYKAPQLEAARRDGEGWKVPPLPAEVFNVNTGDV